MTGFVHSAVCKHSRRRSCGERLIGSSGRGGGQDKSRKVRAVGWGREARDYNGLWNLAPSGVTLAFRVSLCFGEALDTFPPAL
jgi:hypothetical protein